MLGAKKMLKSFICSRLLDRPTCLELVAQHKLTIVSHLIHKQLDAI